MMIRSFLPVGQGAFYCEQFKFADSDKWVNVIYDCGSLKNPKLVEKQIRSNFYKNERIDALFISHLDDDHINGIPYLLKYCNVKRIFFPLVTEKEYLIIKNSIKHGEKSIANLFIESPLNIVPYSETELYCVLPYDNVPDYWYEGERYRLEEHSVRAILSGQEVSDIIFEDKRSIEDTYAEWKYIPFNFNQVNRVEQLKKALYDAFGRNISGEDLQEMWIEKGYRQKIKDAYSNVEGGMNPNSMTLFSGIEENIDQTPVMDSVTPCCLCRCIYRDKYYKFNGCLFTGDYDASNNWFELYNAYKPYWNYIGCVQVPHHGSIYSFNSNLAKMNAFFVISAGSRNSFGHPHARVKREILINRHIPIVVTEKYESMFSTIIDI